MKLTFYSSFKITRVEGGGGGGSEGGIWRLNRGGGSSDFFRLLQLLYSCHCILVLLLEIRVRNDPSLVYRFLFSVITVMLLINMPIPNGQRKICIKLKVSKQEKNTKHSPLTRV